MDCDGKCIQFKKSSRDYATEDSRFCPGCNVFMKWDGHTCPCCQRKLKSKPKNSKRLRTYLSNNPGKAPKRL